MNLLVICQDYPNPNRRDVSAFVHTRNLEYVRRGHRVTVLSFAAARPYAWDGVEVIDEGALGSVADYDACVFHAPNLRNAFRFLRRHRARFRRVCLIGHGHEFLNWYAYLPEPFAFDLNLKKRLRRIVQRGYDRVKLKVWAWFFRRYGARAPGLILVSNAMRRDVERDMGVDFDRLGLNWAVINNPVHPAFVADTYRTPAAADADFVTIRSFDNPKYAVDLVVEMARRMPACTFHLYGQGRYFDHEAAPPNLRVIHEKFKQVDLPGVLARYRCVLLPTRQDTQGVMGCEVACFGMPLWTSDLNVCHEMMGDFPNVRFLDNLNLPAALEIPPVNPKPDRERFAMERTVHRELDFIERLPPFNLSR